MEINKTETDTDTSGIYGIVLAAGYSSRMGDFKPLLPIGDRTAIEKVLEALKKLDLEQIIAVTGFQRERLAPVLEKVQVCEAYNENFAHGMFTSIQTGIGQALSECRGNAEGFFLIPVDCPLVPNEVLEKILKKHKESPNSFIVPCYRGKKGHPLFIPAIYAKEILTYEGEGGLKAITNKYDDNFIRLETDHESVVMDMDTREGYQEILDHYDKQLRGLDVPSDISLQWKKLLAGRRLFLIRHGQTKQHKEKIFLGQADIPLSEEGREQARNAGLQLKRYKVQTDRIYTSDLCRASETAEIIGESLGDQKMYYIKDKALREMALGEWDGRFISEIQELYPEEFKKRGENLLTYKYGNDSENFYDLQYRIVKSFEGILRLESHEAKLLKNRIKGAFFKDIVVVAHSGVIKVILSNLYGTELSKELKETIPNGGITAIDFTGKDFN